MPRVKNFNYAAPGTSVTGWFDVADRAENHSCKERRAYGRCNCGSGKKINPCLYSISISDHCKIRALSYNPIPLDGGGQTLPVSVIQTFFRRKTCHQSRAGNQCNHAGCIKTEAVIEWLADKV